MKHTLSQILEIEPRLQEVIDFVLLPIQKEREYYEIWSDCKIKTNMQNYVGWFAENKLLCSMNDFDTFTDHILKLIYANSKDDNEE